MSEKQGLLSGFKAFLMRGNVVDLAVAVVVGAAFTKIVNSVVEGVINPVVGSIGPKDLDRYQACIQGPCAFDKTGATVSGITIKWGSVLSATLTFLITAAVVYFLMIVPMNKLKERLDALDAKEAAETAATPAQKTEVELLAEIRDVLIAARRQGDGGPGAAVLTAQRGVPGDARSGSAQDQAGRTDGSGEAGQR